MKITKHFFILIAAGLMLAPTARAQDAAAPFRRSTPASAARSPTPIPTATPTPAPSPESDVGNVSSSPSPMAEEENTPAPPPAPEAQPASAAKPEEVQAIEPDAPEPRDGFGTAAMLKRLEKQWEASANDPDVIRKIVAEDFMGVSPDGKIITKSAMLKRAGKSKPEDSKGSARSMDVRFYGSDVAVITGIARETGRDKEGEKFSMTYRFLDTWMKRRGKWQCIASHAMVLP